MTSDVLMTSDVDYESRAASIKTYRYLRLAMVGLVGGIFASIFIEWCHAGGSLGSLRDSISSYYYSPARGMFVAALFAIGICLVCVRGGTAKEDALLNIAGILAPIVAMVPTPPDKSDPNVAALLAARQEAVANNFPALLFLGLCAVVILIVLSVITKTRGIDDAPPSRGDIIGFTVAALIGIAFGLWYWTAQESFLAGAHYVAAISMFVLIATVAIIDGGHAKNLQGKSTRGWAYIGIGWTMIIAGGGIMGVNLLHPFTIAVLLAEALLILLFAVFWAMQTVDLWQHISRAQAINAGD